MLKGTFKTDGDAQFSRDYEATALLQKGFNAQIIEDLVAYILRVIPTAKEKPIKILDLCCGDGGITYALLQKLNEQGIHVEKIIGYDISTEQIDVAIHKYGEGNPQLDFKVQDIAIMSNQNEFDVVISLFGLHWLADINAVAEKIHQALKPDGKLMYFVPLEKTKLFELRQSIVGTSEWQSHFNDYNFSPFLSKPEEYIQAFASIFDSEDPEGLSGMQTVEFEADRFKIFLSSWMQELRHIHAPEDKQRYLDELLAKLPEKDGTTCNDVEVNRDSTTGEFKVHFHERCFWYHGQRRNLTREPTDDLTNDFQQPQQPRGLTLT